MCVFCRVSASASGINRSPTLARSSGQLGKPTIQKDEADLLESLVRSLTEVYHIQSSADRSARLRKPLDACVHYRKLAYSVQQLIYRSIHASCC